MKKLMMAVAIVCAAAGIQAATVSWGVKSVMTPDSDGDYTTTPVGSAAKFAVYLVTAETFNNTSVDAIYDAYKSVSASYSGSTAMGSKTLTSADSYTTGDKVYAFQLITYNDGENDWYVANKSWVEIAAIESVAQNASVSALNSTLGGETDAKSWTGSGGTIYGWEKVESVPEPFSGTLALLGMGAIALRRKMKKAKKA